MASEKKNDAIIAEDEHEEEKPPKDSANLLAEVPSESESESEQESEGEGEVVPPRPQSILYDPNNNNNNNAPKKHARFDPDASVMPEGADVDEWNWFTSLRSKIENSNQNIKKKIENSNQNIKKKIENSNQNIKKKIEQSNKAIEETFEKSNKLIEEKFYEGLGAVTSAPTRARDSIREKHHHRIEMKEHHQSEHWKHERKLLTKFESLDYTTIYNKSYRTELYQRFFDVSGSYEWLRWILSFFIAVFIGLIAWIAKVAINGITEAKFTYVEKANEINLGLGFVVYFFTNVILAFLGAMIAVYYEPTAAGSGIPEVKAYLNGTKVPRFLRLRTLFGKVTSMVFANAANLQVGAEGPMIHIGAIIGNGVSQMQSKELGFKIPLMKHFRNDRDKRDFITSGAGAGVAAAFGAPLGGTLFSLEEVASFWSTLLTWRTFFTCMVSVFAMKLLSEVQAGKYIDSGLMIFNVGESIDTTCTSSSESTDSVAGATTEYQMVELFPFLLIGVVGGLLGAAFTALNLWVSRLRTARINVNPKFRVAEVVAIAVVSSCLQFLLPFMSKCKDISEVPEALRDDLTQHFCESGEYNQLASILFTSNEKTIKNLFSFSTYTTIELLPIFSFFIFYTLGAAYTAGSGISSGMFVPMVVIGAAYGRVVGLILQTIYGSSIHPGIYAIMGAAAFMAGVSRLTVSLTVIIIEITNDLANLLPIMLAVMSAKITADFIIHPLFDQQIEMKHIPYLEPNPVKEMKILMCKHIMAKHPKCVSEKETIGNILTVLKNTVHNGFPVVNNHREKYVKGIILRPQLLVLLDKLSKIWISRTDLAYSHQEYQTKLAWNLPKLQEILDAFEEDDYGREIDLTPYINITVYTVSEEFAVSEAFTMFRTLGLRHLVVVSERNKLKGMITKKDLLEHSCIEKYKELKALKKMNIDLPEDNDDSTPGTPAEGGAIRLTDHLRKRLSPHGTPSRSPSSSLINSQVIYAIDPPAAEQAEQVESPHSPSTPRL